MTATNSVPSPERAREELVATLNAIEDRLNVPKRAKAKINELKETNPGALIAGAAGVAAGVGLVVWGIVRSFTK
ncbi:hypothetical protein GCM10027416_02880 [Okibacterium endophyticum]